MNEKVARVRISRVRMKAGGADVRVIQARAQDTECQTQVRSWVKSIGGKDRPPDAIFCIAMWAFEDCPGGYDTETVWQTDSNRIPFDLLPDLACSIVKRQIGNKAAERTVMRALGYVPDDTPAA